MIEIRSTEPLDVEDKLVPRVLEAFKSGVTRVTMHERGLLEIETEDGCCLQVTFKNIAVPAEGSETEIPYLRRR